MELTLIILLTFSMVVVPSLFCNYLQYRQIKLLKKKGQESYEVKDLLHDLTAGRAIVKMERIAPVDVLLRSPREGIR